MPIFKQATGFDDQRKLYRAIAQDLVQGGMALVSVDGDSSRTDPANIPEDVATLVLAATPTMDPLADDQPWRLLQADQRHRARIRRDSVADSR